MTQSELERIVAEWQRRLHLGNYRLTLQFDQDVELGDAAIDVKDDYEEARIRFTAKDWPSWDERKANLIVVHELLHCVENVTALPVEACEDVLSKQAYALLSAWYNHAAENLVDRLAYILVELGGCA